MLLKKTTNDKNNYNESYTSFVRAFTMIQASSAAGVSFFNKKRLQRELQSYMNDLKLLDFSMKNQDEKNAIIEEWTAFAHSFISSCADSKAYCSTLFGIVPIKDAAVAQKIASQIDVVTRTYPASLNMAEYFEPFRKVLIDTYCQMIEKGETYFI